MCTPRALFPRLFLKICVFVLSLYTVGRLVTLPYEISFKSPSLQIRDPGQNMVCIHTCSESDNALLRYGRLKFSKMAAILNLLQPEMAPFDPPSPKTPPWNQTWRGSADALQSYGHLKFSQNVWIGPEVGRWSLVGRSVVNIHTSYTDLIYSSFATLGM